MAKPDWQNQSFKKDSGHKVHDGVRDTGSLFHKPKVAHMADGGIVDDVKSFFKDNFSQEAADKKAADREASARESAIAKGTDDTSTWDRLKAGNIDDKQSEAYWRWGAGKGQTDDARFNQALEANKKEADADFEKKLAVKGLAAYKAENAAKEAAAAPAAPAAKPENASVKGGGSTSVKTPAPAAGNKPAAPAPATAKPTDKKADAKVDYSVPGAPKPKGPPVDNTKYRDEGRQADPNLRNGPTPTAKPAAQTPAKAATAAAAAATAATLAPTKGKGQPADSAAPKAVKGAHEPLIRLPSTVEAPKAAATATKAATPAAKAEAPTPKAVAPAAKVPAAPAVKAEAAAPAAKAATPPAAKPWPRPISEGGNLMENGLFAPVKPKAATPAPKAESKPVPAAQKPEPKPAPTAPKVEAKPSAKPTAQEQKAPTKAEAKPVPKAAPKTEPKPAPKPAPKAAPKAEAKPVPKAEQKPAPAVTPVVKTMADKAKEKRGGVYDVYKRPPAIQSNFK